MNINSAVPAAASKKSSRKLHPSKEQIALLPDFAGLQLEQIVLLESSAQFEQALALIKTAGVVGFDTESKPVFAKGGISDGPHVVQIALDDRAFIILVGSNPPIEFLKAVCESKAIIKVGIGLKSDRSHFVHKFGFQLQGAVDLTQPLRSLGYKQALGAKSAVAVLLGQNLKKSKSVSTSNWAMRPLQPAQLLYAANDAYCALKLFQALGSPLPGPQTRRKAMATP